MEEPEGEEQTSRQISGVVGAGNPGELVKRKLTFRQQYREHRRIQKASNSHAQR